MTTYMQRLGIIGTEMIKLTDNYTSYLRMHEVLVDGKKSVMDYNFNTEPKIGANSKSEMSRLLTEGWQEGEAEAYQALRLLIVERMTKIHELIV